MLFLVATSQFPLCLPRPPRVIHLYADKLQVTMLPPARLVVVFASGVEVTPRPSGTPRMASASLHYICYPLWHNPQQTLGIRKRDLPYLVLRITLSNVNRPSLVRKGVA